MARIFGKAFGRRGARGFVSFFGALFPNLRQIGFKPEICRKAKSHFPGLYVKYGENDKVVVNFPCLDGPGCVPGKPSSVPSAHLLEMMHPIYDRKAKKSKSVVNPENGIFSFTSNSSKHVDLS